MELEFGEFQRGTEQLQLRLLSGEPAAGPRIGNSLSHHGQLDRGWPHAQPLSTADVQAGQDLLSKGIGPPRGWLPSLAEPDLGEGFARRESVGLPVPAIPVSRARYSSIRAASVPEASLAGLGSDEASRADPGMSAAGSADLQCARWAGTDALGVLSGKVSSFSQETQALLRQIQAISI